MSIRHLMFGRGGEVEMNDVSAVWVIGLDRHAESLEDLVANFSGDRFAVRIATFALSQKPGQLV